MKKLTLLGLAILLASSSLVMAAGEAGQNDEPKPNVPGFFSRQWTNVKEKSAAVRDGYVNRNVRIAQWTGEKLGLGIAAKEAVAPDLGNDEDGNPVEGPVSAKPSSIQAHSYRTTGVVSALGLAAAFGLYKLGQKTGVNAKIAQAKDAVCKALGLNFLVSKKETEKSQVATIKAAIANCKELLAQKGLSNEDRVSAQVKLSELEIALKNPGMRDAALELE